LGSAKELAMLRIYPVILQLVSELRPVLDRIDKRDADLGRQARRALTSVPLNACEGTASSKGTRRARYESAHGSAHEVRACLEVAVALGYLEAIDAGVLDRLGRVICTLRKLAA
jgi:four helix bundle protein